MKLYFFIDSYDNVEIFDGAYDRDRPIASYCGSKVCIFTVGIIG